jgi:U3 small nucleolar RNA-associated protein 5
VDRPQTSVNAIAAEEEQALVRQDMDLPVEGDMADLTLGERLALQDPGAHPATPAKGHAATTVDGKTGSSLGPQNAQSLTRLLLQALHTSDPQLLSMILTSPSNSSPTLIRNTIRKLPTSMALPLLKACVDRLGKGKAFNKRGGGRGGGLNEKQGLVVVAWIRGVLVERGNVLMTVSLSREGSLKCSFADHLLRSLPCHRIWRLYRPCLEIDSSCILL